MAKQPLDTFPYEQDSRARTIDIDLSDGVYVYVYVQDIQGLIWVLPDGPHLHPQVLGQARLAKYAGDLTIQNQCVVDVTNLSGTFQFGSQKGLLEVTQKLEEMGFTILRGAVRLFSQDPLDPSGPKEIQ